MNERRLEILRANAMGNITGAARLEIELRQAEIEAGYLLHEAQ
jgi:hypothetical protein